MCTPPDTTRFVVDHMLTKLGRTLRCLGCDVAAEEPGLSSRELLRCAEAEGRVLLTRNKRLARESRSRSLALVEGDDPRQQLASVVRSFGLDPRARPFTRCLRCNAVLLEADAEQGRARGVPEAVLERHARFWSCPCCASFFWRGTHVRNTCARLGIEPPAGC